MLSNANMNQLVVNGITINKKRDEKYEDKFNKGKPFLALFLFALPMILSVTLQQFYNICDSMIAGKFVSSKALAAVSASYPITMIYLAIGAGFGVGVNIVVSRFIGENNLLHAKQTIYTSILTIVLTGLILTIVGYFLVGKLIQLINVSDDYYNDAVVYLKYYTLGIIFLFLYNVVTSIFQAIGNSRIPLYFLIFSTLLNIGLDIYFVTIFNMGVEGLALATFIAQMIASIVSFLVLIIYVKKCIGKEKKILNFSILKKILPIALPSIIQASTISIGQLLIQTLINKQGSDVVAGYGAAYKISYVVINIFVTISNALSTYVSQNAGAKEYKRINQGFISATIMCIILTIVTTTLFLTMPNVFLSIFEKENEPLTVTETGCMFLTTIAPFIFLMAAKIPCDGVLKGCKDMRSFIIGTMADLVIRVVFSYILVEPLGVKGIFIAWPIGWAIGAILSITFYFIGRWKNLIGYERQTCTD